MRALSALLPLALTTACAGGPVRDTLRFVVTLDATSPRDGGRVLAESPPLDPANDPWVRFFARYEEVCSRPHRVDLERITLATRPPTPLERLFDRFVLVSMLHPAQAPLASPWARPFAFAIARGERPAGAGSLALDRLWTTGGTPPWSPGTRIVVLATVAPTMDKHLPVELLLELQVAGRCGQNI